MTNFAIRSDEFANPNVWLKMVLEDDVEIRKVLSKVRAVPITVSYDLAIILSSEIDIFKCSQAILDTLWLYRFMWFEHNFMNIDAVMLLPDSNTVEINREKNMTGDNTIKLSISFEVQTYYPALRRDRVGGADGNNLDLSKVLPGGVYDPNYIVSPKRTRWYNNLLKTREKTNPGTNNPNSGDPNKNK
jgi:hypothetical protein